MSEARPLYGAPRWILGLEIAVLAAILLGMGVVRFSRITPVERLEIQLEAGLLQLHALEADHFAREAVYRDPRAWCDYLPWMERYAFDARVEAKRGWSVVVHADLDGDGEPGAWRIDQRAALVERVGAD